MSKYTIIIRQINTSGNKGIWDRFHTDDAEAGRAWIVKTMHFLNTDGTCPKVQTVGNGRVPVTCQIFYDRPSAEGKLCSVLVQMLEKKQLITHHQPKPTHHHTSPL